MTRTRRRAVSVILAGLFAVACAGVGVAACARDRSDTPDPEPEKFDNGGLWLEPADYGALRTEYGDRRDFSARCVVDRPLRVLYTAANDADWQTVLKTSSVWLESCPVDIDAHYLRAIALREMGNVVDSDAHVAWFRGLVDSVLVTGDGRSAESPFVVISVDEEYAILRALRLERSGQSLLEGGIDAIEVEDLEGNRATIYFLPAAHWRRLSELFGEDG